MEVQADTSNSLAAPAADGLEQLLGRAGPGDGFGVEAVAVGEAGFVPPNQHFHVGVGGEVPMHLDY